MNQMTDGHTVERYNQELQQLHGLVLKMAQVGRDQLANAIVSIEEEDTLLANEVVERDNEMNAMDEDAGNQIVHIIARRQPVARDLREVLTVGKVVADLERIGDQARRIAKLSLRLYDNDTNLPNHGLLRDIPRMAAYADRMVEKAVRAFDELDIQQALDVIKMEDELGDDFQSAIRRLSTFVMEDSRSVGHMVGAVLGLRSLERIGGHACNIARHTIFLIRGEDVRHDSFEKVVETVGGNLQ